MITPHEIEGAPTPKPLREGTMLEFVFIGTEQERQRMTELYSLGSTSLFRDVVMQVLGPTRIKDVAIKIVTADWNAPIGCLKDQGFIKLPLQ